MPDQANRANEIRHLKHPAIFLPNTLHHLNLTWTTLRNVYTKCPRLHTSLSFQNTTKAMRFLPSLKARTSPRITVTQTSVFVNAYFTKFFSFPARGKIKFFHPHGGRVFRGQELGVRSQYAGVRGQVLLITPLHNHDTPHRPPLRIAAVGE